MAGAPCCAGWNDWHLIFLEGVGDMDSPGRRVLGHADFLFPAVERSGADLEPGRGDALEHIVARQFRFFIQIVRERGQAVLFLSFLFSFFFMVSPFLRIINIVAAGCSAKAYQYAGSGG